MIDAWIKLVRAHERLLLAVAILATILLMSNHVLDYMTRKAQAKVSTTATVLAAQEVKDTALAATVAQQQAAYQQLARSLEAQNAALEAQIAARSASQAAQQQVVAHESLQEVATEWATSLKVPPVEVQEVPAGVLVAPDAARATLDVLNKVPVLQANLSDLQVISANQTTQLASSQKIVSALTSQVAGLQLQGADAIKACVAQTTELKRAARGGKLKWFERGLGVGATVALLLLK